MRGIIAIALLAGFALGVLDIIRRDVAVQDTHGQVGVVWSLAADPTVAPGIAAPQWQFLIRTDSPSLYYKSGTANTAWTKVGAGGGGSPTLGDDVTQSMAGGGNFRDLASPGTHAGIRIINYAGVVSFICGIDSTGVSDGRVVFLWADGPANTLGLLPDSNANCAAVPAADRFWQFNTAALTDVGGAMYRYSTTKSRWVLATYPQ